ncbi:MAG: acyl-CoA dehydratase activase-related protein [Clostridium sp.]|nr:acyl-CoA dehydratase activase-related protein [Clostridium sp.]MCM1444105.1 acyl-CoA dehydratase activase-related protein [Candidatus Amulumruptor caecigallinarius]
MTIGIPRSMFYYYLGGKWKYFFEYLKINTIISPKTNREILDNGSRLSQDEMCLSLKSYIGHVNYLKDKCDYVLIPRIDNYGIRDQTCTNFLAVYDIINNIFNINILDYNINLENKETELKGLLKFSKILNKTKMEIKRAYEYACIKDSKDRKRVIINNMNKLSSTKLKILLIGHSYNINDALIGKPVINYLQKLNCEIIYCDRFDFQAIKDEVKKYSENLYWKYSKENVASLKYLDKIDGIVFLSVFPCGLDSLVNELIFRKIDKPYLNLILDDLSGDAGMETRIESFVDIFEY